MALAVGSLTEATRLGQLALEAELVDAQTLETCLERARGADAPLGAAMVDAGVLTPRRLGELLVEQQRRRRQPGVAAPRLTEREHRLLGLWLVDRSLVDIETLVSCRDAQLDALRAGRHRLLGEVILERDLIPPGRMDSMLDCLSSPADIGERFAHAPERRRLLELYLAPPELGERERHAVRVVVAPRSEDLERAHLLSADSPVLVGRAVEQGVSLLDARVSTPHCQLRLVDGALEITDLGSRNGTFVDGERVERATLAPGQELSVGDSTLRFVVAGGSSSGNSTVDSVMSELTESLEIIDVGEQEQSDDQPIAIAATRAIFREFHARRAQIEAIASENTRPVRELPRLRPGFAATTALEAVRQPGYGRAIAVGLVVLCIAMLGLTSRLRAPLTGHPEPDRRTRIEKTVPYTVETHAPPVPIPQLAVGQRMQFYGAVAGWRWLRSGDRVSFSGAVVESEGQGRTLLVQGARALLEGGGAEAGAPLPDGSKVRVHGTVRAFVGPPARLPDGSRTRLYVEVERVELYR